ncbi:11780_t:CDS:2 [Funneliformis geosporum]|uniref:11780_t:CDS:1 n=1 Tax=Funneliformis geosporum TaxID=1117311 RepID=A0A9W4SCT4_9GLOM|nr:11780_t:CDS:2 [Funneliformis geosporum]
MSTNLSLRLVLNVRLVIPFRTGVRYFTKQTRQITNSNVTTMINTNGKPSPKSPKQKKPSSIGVKEPPRILHKTEAKTWLEKLKYSFNFNELRIQGEKLWEANQEMIKAKEALYIPNINARSLLKSNIDTVNLLKGNTTLFAVYFNRFGENHVKTYIEPFLAEFSNKPKIQLMQLNVETNILKSLILKLFIPSIRRAIPQSLHKTYLFLFRNDQTLHEALNIHNTYRGYVFVIDADCKIRWFAHGDATQKEIETLLKIITNLGNLDE